MSEADYDAFLASHPFNFRDFQSEAEYKNTSLDPRKFVTFNKYFTTTTGPLGVEASGYWPSNEIHPPLLQLAALTDGIPNLLLGSTYGTAIIDSVQDRNGVDLRDSNERFWAGTRQLIWGPFPRSNTMFLRGGVGVQLRPGTRKEDIRRVTGTIILRLPIDVEALEFPAASPPGETRTTRDGAVSVTLYKTNRGATVAYYHGPKERHLAFTGYDQEKRKSLFCWQMWQVPFTDPLPPGSPMSFFPNSYPMSATGVMGTYFQFVCQLKRHEEAVVTLAEVVARYFAERSFPFVLEFK